MGDRIWVDLDETKDFVANILTVTGPASSLAVPEPAPTAPMSMPVDVSFAAPMSPGNGL
jgi:hypothetical protein